MASSAGTSGWMIEEPSLVWVLVSSFPSILQWPRTQVTDNCLSTVWSTAVFGVHLWPGMFCMDCGQLGQETGNHV